MTFETLTDREVYRVLRDIPAAVRKQLRRENAVIAGGVIRDTVAGLPVKDIDIFCHSQEQAERLALEASPFVKRTVFAYSVDLGIPVQYVFYKDFTTPEDLISQFDFRACCAGIYWVPFRWENCVCVEGHWAGVAVAGFHDDCRDKALRFMSQQKDVGKLTAFARALTLAKKGWTLSTEDAVSILTHFEPTLTPERVRYAFRPGYGGPR